MAITGRALCPGGGSKINDIRDAILHCTCSMLPTVLDDGRVIVELLTNGSIQFKAGVTIKATLVGGGGSGGARTNSSYPAPGGGGGYVVHTQFTADGSAYPVVIGDGGAAVLGVSGVNKNGNEGGTTSAFGASAAGGNGGTLRDSVSPNQYIGGAGGSGGGSIGGAGGSNGSDGGVTYPGSITPVGGKGSGKTTYAFADATTGKLYAGGGAGGTYGSAGGAGGGGSGQGGNGAANTGGGGAGQGTANLSGAGGSGVVALMIA